MGEWIRVSKECPCPICRKEDWCGVSADGEAVCCMRVEAPKRAGNGGYIHRLGGSVATAPPKRTRKPRTEPKPDFDQLASEYQASVNADALAKHAGELAVSVESLSRLGIGWDGEAWTYPMRDATGRVVGIRRRFDDGRKLSVRGGHEGLFVPSGLSATGTLYVAEGPTDTAALLTLGLNAIGRPNCRGAVELTREHCKGKVVVVVADADGPGREGADALAEVLVLSCESVRIITPPNGVKDARAWLQSGATKLDVEELASKAEPLTRETVSEFRIVRPELFHLPEVSGVLVATPTLREGKPTAEWVLHLRWHETGRRESRELDALQLPNGERVHFHPWPGKASLTSCASWTTKARKRWLEGGAALEPAAVFQRTCELYAHFLHFTDDIAVGATATLACWTVLTYVYPCWPSLPYLSIGGPVSSGKSTLFRVLGRLCFRPLESSNMTAACLFRTLHDCGGTLLLDEAERLRDSAPEAGELRSILLSGYKQGSPAMRLEKCGNGFSRTAFDVYGPKAFAAIARLPEALASRCIRIGMFRAEPDSPKPRRRLAEKDAEFRELRNELHALALEHGQTWLQLVNDTDVVPNTFSGRDFELWQPLLAIGSWLEEHGVSGIVEVLTTFAVDNIDHGEEDNLPDADVALLTILAEHVRGGTASTLKAGDILAAACARHPTLFGAPDKPRWSPKGISNALRRYGLQTKKGHGSRGRTYQPVTEDQLRAVSRAYGFELL